MNRNYKSAIAMFLAVVWLTGNILGMAGTAQACSNVLLNSKDYIVSGRTMDFDIDLGSEVVVIPAGRSIVVGNSFNDTTTRRKTKYGFVGVNAFHRDNFTDGMNEKGLSLAALWLPETKYPEPKDYPGFDCIPVDDMTEWILGNFADVDEVKQALEHTIITAKFVKELKIIPPLHVALHDAKGNSIVIEFVEGKTIIHDNAELKVLTNEPTYAWHVKGLEKYLDYTNEIATDDLVIYEDRRFVQAYLSNKFVKAPDTAQEAIANMTAIMNKVAVVRGEAKASPSTYANLGAYNYTLWTVIRDHTNKVFYFNDADNLSLRSIDLTKVDFRENAPTVRVKLVGGSYHQPVEGSLR